MVTEVHGVSFPDNYKKSKKKLLKDMTCFQKDFDDWKNETYTLVLKFEGEEVEKKRLILKRRANGFLNLFIKMQQHVNGDKLFHKKFKNVIKAEFQEVKTHRCSLTETLMENSKDREPILELEKSFWSIYDAFKMIFKSSDLDPGKDVTRDKKTMWFN